MTPKEKAKQLVGRYCTMYSHCDDAEECALLAADEVYERLIWHVGESNIDNLVLHKDIEYWEEVKKEILNLKS